MEQKKKYSQLKAFFALTKASLISTLNNPSTLIFSLVFPFVFIIVFGFIGNNSVQIKIAPDKNINKDNPIYQALEKNSSVKFITDKSDEEIEKDLKEGRIDAKLNIKNIVENDEVAMKPVSLASWYQVNLTTSAASPQSGAIAKSLVGGIIDKTNLNYLSSGNNQNLPASLFTNEVQGRQFKTIDFILPGQLGFSLLSLGIFGTAFVFVALRETLVLKRFFATPIKKVYIVLGEGLSRLIFSLIQASIIIGVGTFFLGFTLVHGWITFFSMLVLATLGLIVFLGFGFLVSGIAKDENAVPPLANLITLPQFLLAGTFFPTDAFPSWLQPISNILPLTFLNEAMRKVAFEGVNLWDVRYNILFLLIWGVVVYVGSIKLFRWE